MEVVLISKDADLKKVCREILGEVLGAGWNFTFRDDHRGLPTTADLHVWDCEPGTDLLERLNVTEWQKHLILWERDQVAVLQESRFPKVNIILKPFSASTLRAFLAQASGRFRQTLDLQNNQFMQTLRADRDELLQCVIQANLKLQEYDQDRTNFLARAVHDFRAPLTALTGYCGLLLGEQLGAVTPDQREVLQRMQNSAKRLSRMANAMFQLSIWQRVEQEPILQRNDIQESIEQALHETLQFTEAKRIRVTVDITPPEEMLSFEKSQIEQVLINLLDNASKFTPRSGSIEIRGYPDFWERRLTSSSDRSMDRRVGQIQQPNAFRIDIRDSGPGIPQEQLDHIFEEYTTYGGGQDRSGGGLGLAICKMLIKRHQGGVWAKSTPAGAVFSFVLPFHRPGAHLPAASRVQSNVAINAI